MDCEYVSWLLRITFIDGLSLLNEDGGLNVFFPNNSVVTNSTLTHTNTPRNGGTDHIVCYGMSNFTTTVTWHNSSGERLEGCGGQKCQGCGSRCQRNGGVGVDPSLLRHTHIHVYTSSNAYENQDLECRLYGGGGIPSFIGVYLKEGGESCIVQFVYIHAWMLKYTQYTIMVDSYKIWRFFKSRRLTFLHIIMLMKVLFSPYPTTLLIKYFLYFSIDGCNGGQMIESCVAWLMQIVH